MYTDLRQLKLNSIISNTVINFKQTEPNVAEKVILLDEPVPTPDPAPAPQPDLNPAQQPDLQPDLFFRFDPSPKPTDFAPTFDLPDFGMPSFSEDPFSQPKVGFEPSNLLAVGQVDNKYAVFRQLEIGQTSSKPVFGNTGLGWKIY